MTNTNSNSKLISKLKISLHLFPLVVILMFFVVVFNSCSSECTSAVCQNFEETDLKDLARAATYRDSVEFDEILMKEKFSLTTSMGKKHKSFITCLMYDDNEVMLKHIFRTKLVEINLNEIRPVILSSCMAMEFELSNGLKYYKMFLQQGADPNLTEDGRGAFGEVYAYMNPKQVYPIIDLLLKYGWDINNKNMYEYTVECVRTNVFLVKYLIDRGADWKGPFKQNVNGEKRYIWNYVRTWIFPLDSEEQKIKLELIKLFETTGYDYKSDTIPADVMKTIERHFPNEKERLEYIEKY